MGDLSREPGMLRTECRRLVEQVGVSQIQYGSRVLSKDKREVGLGEGLQSKHLG